MRDQVYEPGKYAGIVRSEIRAIIEREGWTPYVIDEPAGYTYEPHHHAESKLIVVLEGEMEVTLGDDALRCRPGDRLTIPGGEVHAAVMGECGCLYFWSEQVRS